MIDIVLRTQAGWWAPLVWLAVFIIALAVAYVIRSAGKKDYKRGTEQTVPFFSGARPPEGNIAPGNLYWGFTEALKKYYRWIMRAHTGMVNDYIYSFVVLLVILLAALIFGGSL
jgi:hypothetical protein